MTTGKTISLTRWIFVGKVISLFFNMLVGIVFLPRIKCLNLMAAVTICNDFGAPKNSFTVSIVSPSIYHQVMGLDAMILVFGMLSFKPTFSLFSFTFIKRLLSSAISPRGRPWDWMLAWKTRLGSLGPRKWLLVTWSCLTLCDPMDCNPPDSSVHGVLQARILEWVAIPFSKGWSQPRDQIHVFCVACFGRRVTTSATWGTLSPWLEGIFLQVSCSLFIATLEIFKPKLSFSRNVLSWILQAGVLLIWKWGESLIMLDCLLERKPTVWYAKYHQIC